MKNTFIKGLMAASVLTGVVLPLAEPAAHAAEQTITVSQAKNLRAEAVKRLNNAELNISAIRKNAAEQRQLHQTAYERRVKDIDAQTDKAIRSQQLKAEDAIRAEKAGLAKRTAEINAAKISKTDKALLIQNAKKQSDYRISQITADYNKTASALNKDRDSRKAAAKDARDAAISKVNESERTKLASYLQARDHATADIKKYDAIISAAK